MFPPFPERVGSIIRNASNLQYLSYIAIDHDHSSDFSVELFQTIITALESSDIKPELSITSRRPIVGKPFGDLLAYISDRFTVKELDILSEGTEDAMLLQLLARFPQLQQLVLWFFGLIDSDPQDMDLALRHLPLKELRIYDSEQFASLPRQVQTLDIQLDDRILTDSLWTAARNLRQLSDLNIECDDVEGREDEQPLIFSSSELRSVSLSLRARTEEIIRRQIIQPIFTSSQHITYIELHTNTSISSNLLALVLSIETLVNVEITSTASPFTFLDLASFPKILPNLKSLRLPWPATIGIPTNDDDGMSMDWRNARDHSQDVPDRLSFDSCRRLAAQYPKLEDIVFEIDIAGQEGNELLDWIKSSSANSISYPNGLESNRMKIVRHVNNPSFADERSPCLNICCILCYSGPPISALGNEGISEPVFACIFLNQVRRHPPMPYLLLPSYTNCKV
jgi:hypothetical protein